MTADLLNLAYSRYIASPESGTTDLYNGVKQYASKMMRNHSVEDAEDVTGEVTAEVWRSLPSYTGLSSFSTWVHRLIQSSIIDRVRSERRRPYLQGSEDDVYANISPADTDTPTMNVDDLPSLTPAERQLVQQLIETPDYDELADKLGISVIALRNRFYRIKNKCDAERYDLVAVDD